MTSINRGSEWRKWDLHLHTASSYDAYKGKDSDELLVQKLNYYDIKLVAITDHFIIDKERIENLRRLAPEIVFLPGVELRTDKGDSNIHVILIFSDKINFEDLCSNFEYFRRNKAKNSDNNDKIYWDYNDIVEFAKENSGIISLHAGSKTNGVDDRIPNTLKCSQAIKEEYALTVDIFELGKKEDVDNYKKYVFPSIGKRPLILSSDNHDPRDYNDDRIVWIKSDLTFEGLKQIIYEPEERIRYGKNYPDTKPDYMVIDYIEFNEGERIYFNRGLNSIIGGRSTGKSTLLNSIAENQQSKNFDKDKHNLLKKYNVVWSDGISDKKREIEFIPQEFMISISTDEEMFNNLLSEIISKKNKDSEKRRYLKKVEDICNRINVVLNDYFLQLSSQRNLIKPEGDEEAARNSISGISKNIEKIRLENYFSEEDNKNYKDMCEKINSLVNKIEKLELEELKLVEIKNLDFSVNVELSEIDSLNKSLIEEKLKVIKESSIKQWMELIENLVDKVRIEIKDNKQELELIKNSETYKKGKDLESKNEELEQLKKQLEIHEKIFKEINLYNKKYKQIQEILVEKYNMVLDIFEEYFKAIKQFKDKFIIEENELKIEIKMSILDFEKKIDYLNARNKLNNDFIEKFNNNIKNFDKNNFKEFFNNFFEYNRFSFNRNKNIDDLFKDIVTTNWFKYDYRITYQNDEFQDMSQGKKAFVILKLLLEFSDDKKPVLIDQPEDSLDNRAIYHELRKYLLDTKKNRQIIVVTHNPNVVVGADAENIIVAHQQSKIEKNKNGKKFQYINGSLENTNSKDKSCEFILESQGIREHIFDVLEGGEEAFSKREQKYNYKKFI